VPPVTKVKQPTVKRQDAKKAKELGSQGKIQFHKKHRAISKRIFSEWQYEENHEQSNP